MTACLQGPPCNKGSSFAADLRMAGHDIMVGSLRPNLLEKLHASLVQKMSWLLLGSSATRTTPPKAILNLEAFISEGLPNGHLFPVRKGPGIFPNGPSSVHSSQHSGQDTILTCSCFCVPQEGGSGAGVGRSPWQLMEFPNTWPELLKVYEFV